MVAICYLLANSGPQTECEGGKECHRCGDPTLHCDPVNSEERADLMLMAYAAAINESRTSQRLLKERT